MKLKERLSSIIAYIAIGIVAIVTIISFVNKSIITKEDISRDAYALQTHEDGKYKAHVDYTNKCTNYLSSYEVAVKIEADTLNTIYFDNGGYINRKKIIVDAVDKDGYVMIKDKDGCKTYEIQLISMIK